MLILIEKEITEMNLNIDCAINLFSLKYEFLYKLGLDGILGCFVPPL